MKAGSRPQYYRIRRMLQMVREGAETGYLPNSSDFMREFEVSRRTVARDLDFLRDEERAPLAYDDARHGFGLTDETYTLPPMRISRKEAFSFGLARKLLAHYEDTPLHLDIRSVLDKIAESLEDDVTIEPDWLSEHVGVLPDDCVRIDPEVWAQMAGYIERREEIRATYQTFDGRVSEYKLYILLVTHRDEILNLIAQQLGMDEPSQPMSDLFDGMVKGPERIMTTLPNPRHFKSSAVLVPPWGSYTAPDGPEGALPFS